MATVQMIRFADPTDVPRIVALGREMVEESPVYSVLTYNPLKTELYFHRAIADPNQILLVYGDYEGFFAGSIRNFWFADGAAAWDQAIFVSKSARGKHASQEMIEVFTEWAESHDVVATIVGTSTGVASGFEKLVTEIGFVQMGQSFMRRR